MEKFKYVATDKSGKRIKGNFVAENETEMKEMLLKAGYYVISSRKVSSVDLSSFFSVSGKVKVSELSQFCNQFSIMIASGIGITEAIDVCAGQSFSSKLKSTLAKIAEDLRQGVLLSDAMAKHPKVFPPFFSSMVFVGEAAGCLDRVLVSVAEYYQLEEKTKKKVRGSLAYPAILLVMLVGVVGVMLGFVIPSFVGSFAKMNIEMPALTMAIFNMSAFFRDNILYILAFTFAIVVVIWLLNMVPSVKEFRDKLAVTLPVFKRINMAIFTSRFCRSLGLLLSSGSDSLQALEILRKTISNRYLGKKFDKVINDVKMGMNLSAALSAEMGLSPVLIQMVIIGEKTGELDRILTQTAPYFDSQAETSLNLITTIVQPAVMLLLGAVVAVLFVAVYSPILSMIQNLKT
ncbi:MAG: type II secretion system F family protein [Bacilli bacterium]|nr:type II secretion system F family protein [Bacilli bacterium]